MQMQYLFQIIKLPRSFQGITRSTAAELAESAVAGVMKMRKITLISIILMAGCATKPVPFQWGYPAYIDVNSICQG
jgi:hypothetical protein